MKIFTIFNLRKTIPVSETERECMLGLVRKFAQTEAGKWLNDINFNAADISWCPAMADFDGVMGSFTVFQEKIALLPPNDVADDTRFWCELIVPTLIHELRHQWQWEKKPLKYFLCANPFVRPFTLERDADRVMEIAQDFCDDLVAKTISFEYERTHHHED